jgi:hypothetical protein
MAPPSLLLVLHEKKEVDSISKYVTESELYKAPPSLVDVMELNKQFEIYKLVYERVCLELYVCELKLV